MCLLILRLFWTPGELLVGAPRGIGLRANTKGNRLLHLSDGEFRHAANVGNLQIDNGGLHMSTKDMNSKLEPNEQNWLAH